MFVRKILVICSRHVCDWKLSAFFILGRSVECRVSGCGGPLVVVHVSLDRWRCLCLANGGRKLFDGKKIYESNVYDVNDVSFKVVQWLLCERVKNSHTNNLSRL